MKNILKYVSIALFIATLNSSCVSMWTHNQWKEARAKQAVRVTADGDQVLVGVDVTALDYVKENPGIAAVAAIADIGIAYGTYTVAQDLLNAGGDGSDSQRNNDINVSGNQNSSVSVIISGDQDNDPTTNNDTSNNSYQ